MPIEPAQSALALFEICLLLSGAGLVLWLVFDPAARARWLGTNALPPAPIAPVDFVLAAALVFLTGFAAQAVAQAWLGPVLSKSADQQGLALFSYQVANYAGALLAWRLLFPSLRRTWAFAPEPPRPVPGPALPWPRALRYAAGTLLAMLPLVLLVNLGWSTAVDALGLPNTPQDVIAIFTRTRSPWVIAGMLLVACVLAPIYEELLFRAGLYRFCRQRLGRGWALGLSGVSFGALHANWAGFLPLAGLGMGLALAYEATGSIRVAIMAHALFNLNTVLVLLSGLPDFAK
ncbi:MAG: CPBP family intramembrane metalloprotease [Opitutae bacterium]|nr:CPBP family intramembrane metalloprotease [Opitutae bacterium]